MVNIAANATATFNPYQYVPPAIEDDYATGMSYYSQFSSATQGVSVVNGTLQLSDAAAQKIATAIIQTFEATVPVLGQALAVFLSIAPQAGSGPGVCSTDPPPTGLPPSYLPTQSQLASWDHYQPWTAVYPVYSAGDPSSFEYFANGALQYNWELFANCFSSSITPVPVLLAALIASWNAAHFPPKRTITRSGLNPSGFGMRAAGYDPIAYALENSILADASISTATSTPVSWNQAEAANAAAPHDVTSSFEINDGPLIGGGLAITFGPNAMATATPIAPASASTPLSTGSKVALSVAIVGGTAAAGVGVWAYLTKQGYSEAWSRVWKETGGKLLR